MNGSKLHQVMNLNYGETWIDDLRKLLRSYDQFSATQTIIDTTITDPTGLTPVEGDAYFVPSGAVLPWTDNTIQVWRTGMTTGIDNTDIPDAWEQYTPNLGWVITDAALNQWQVQSDHTLLPYPFDQKANTNSAVSYQSVNANTITASTANVAGLNVTSSLQCSGSAAFSGQVTNTGVITNGIGFHKITIARPITSIYTPPLPATNKRYEEFFSFTLGAKDSIDGSDIFAAFYIFSNTTTYEVQFHTASNHQQYQRSTVSHTGEHGWSGGSAEHIIVSTVSAGFFIDDTSNDPVVTFSATNASNHSTFSFHNQLPFAINCTAYLIIDQTPANP